MLRIRDVYPGSRILIFTHPGSKNSNKRDGWKKISCHNYLCSHKFHKISNYFSFEVLKKKIWANFLRIIEVSTQKIVNKLSKIWVWDLGSGIRDPEKTYSGSRIQGSKRHGIPDTDPQHCSPALHLQYTTLMLWGWPPGPPDLHDGEDGWRRTWSGPPLYHCLMPKTCHPKEKGISTIIHTNCVTDLEHWYSLQAYADLLIPRTF